MNNADYKMHDAINEIASRITNSPDIYAMFRKLLMNLRVQLVNCELRYQDDQKIRDIPSIAGDQNTASPSSSGEQYGHRSRKEINQAQSG